MDLFTPEQFARDRAISEEKARIAAEQAERRARREALREEREARGGEALTNAEYVRRHVALTNELREIPAIGDAARREACRYDFPLFVRTYGAALIQNHMPPEPIVEKFMKPIERSVLFGGQMIVEMPRGIGKTTIVELAIAWAISYRHRRFIVLISATGKLAKANLANIMRVFTSDEYAADFPEVATPFRSLAGKWQMCESQTFLGQKTNIEMKTDHIRMPTLIDASGNILGDAAGAILYSVGVGGAVRGLNEGGLRPDMLFFDDIQKRKDAKSPALSESLEAFVREDAMGLFGHGSMKTALMAITPICEGDFASLMCDSERNPGWSKVILPFVSKWPADLSLVDLFCAKFAEDAARDDFERTSSRQFYIENHEQLTDGVELLDPLVGNEAEVDAFHHVLVILATIGKESFDSEYQMRVRGDGDVLAIDADTVKHALNGYAECVVPDECPRVVGFCDVNIKGESGLRYGLMAVGPGRVCAVVKYGRYPARGRLFPEDTPETIRAAMVGEAVRIVGRILSGEDVRRRDGSLLASGVKLVTRSGRRVVPLALLFDGGNWTRAISRSCRILRDVDKLPCPVSWSLGRSAKKFLDENADTRKKISRAARGDHMYATASANGDHLIVQVDYWREIAQSAFLAPPLAEGSVSLWGDDPSRHDAFAREVCAERLVAREVVNGRLEWRWAKTSPMNHWCDVLTGMFAVASWYRLYESVERMVDRAAARGSAAARPAMTFRTVGGGTVTVGGSAADVPRAAAPRAKAKRFKTRFRIKR